MQQAKRVTQKMSERVDDVVGIFSPKAALRRKQYRFAYDAIDKGRYRKKRSSLGGSGDTQLDNKSLYDLREICRDMMRNNSLVKGLLRTERNGVVGPGVKIEARTEDDGWNAAAEQLWREEMLDNTCDVTGRLNFNQILRMAYLSYRRDGDFFILDIDGKLQLIEGEQVGTPLNNKDAQYYDVVNGIAFSKQTKQVIGYFIGSPDKYGFIQEASYSKYQAGDVYHVFNPERCSQSRGEPALTSSINYIDMLGDYVEAELVAAKVNACFSMFVAQESPTLPDSWEQETNSEGKVERREKIEPGIIQYGLPGEKPYGIGQVRPGTQFDPFIMRMLMFIGRPLCLPMALISLDYSGATFMNMRLAYNEARDNWTNEQDDILKPLVSRIYRSRIEQWVNKGLLKSRDDMFAAELFCRKWPYVDPFREAQADSLQLENRTTTRTAICARQGDDFRDVEDLRQKEEKLIPAPGTGGRPADEKDKKEDETEGD